MLQGVVGIPELGAHAADIGLAGKGQHFFQPVGLGDLDVVVHQHQVFAVSLRHPQVVERGVIERDVGTDDLDALVLGDAVEVGQRFLIGAAVVHDDDLVVRIGSLFQDGIDAHGQQFDPVTGGDDDADERQRIGQSVLDAQQARDAGGRVDLGVGLADALQVRGDGFDLGLEGVVLLFQCQRGAAGEDAPVIEHARHVDDVLGADLLDDAQGQIPVLGAFVADAESPDLFKHTAAVDAKVADHVLRQEEFVVELALEVRRLAHVVFGDLVFVGVDEAGLGMLVCGQRHVGQCMRRQQVVVVHQRDVVAGGDFQRRIGGCRDVAVLFAEDELDARILGSQLGQQCTHGGVGRGVIGDADFPVRIDLGLNRFNGLTQVVQRRVVDGHDDREGGGDAQVLDLLAQGRHGGLVSGVIETQPAVVGIFARLQQRRLRRGSRHVQQALGVADARLQPLNAFVPEDVDGLAGGLADAPAHGDGAAHQGNFLAGSVDGGAHPADGSGHAPAQRLLQGGGEVMQLGCVLVRGLPGGTRFFQRLVGFGQTLLQPFLFHLLEAIQFLLQFSLRALQLAALFVALGQPGGERLDLCLHPGLDLSPQQHVGHTGQLIAGFGRGAGLQRLLESLRHVPAHSQHTQPLGMRKGQMRILGLQLLPQSGRTAVSLLDADQQHHGVIGEPVAPAFVFVAYGLGRVTTIDQQQIDAAGCKARQGLGITHAQQTGEGAEMLTVVVGCAGFLLHAVALCQFFGLPGADGPATGGQAVLRHGLACSKVEVARLGAQLDEGGRLEFFYQPGHERDVALQVEGRNQPVGPEGKHLGKEGIHVFHRAGLVLVGDDAPGRGPDAAEIRCGNGGAGCAAIRTSASCVNAAASGPGPPVPRSSAGWHRYASGHRSVPGCTLPAAGAAPGHSLRPPGPAAAVRAVRFPGQPGCPAPWAPAGGCQYRGRG